LDTDVERAEKSLNDLIERRALEAEQANREAVAWAESAGRYNLARARELRQEWAAYYRHRVQLYEDLAAESRAKLGKLIDGR
jgi:hypothetical protein